MSLYIRIGPMFAGKTSWLNGTLNKLHDIFNYNTIKIVHIDDTRYDNVNGSCHSNNEINEMITVIKTKKCMDIVDITDKYDIIGIDESNFFDDLKIFVLDAINKNKEVYVVGLDGDYKNNKFGQILELIPYSDETIKINAICQKCIDCNRHNLLIEKRINIVAPFSKKIINSDEQKQIGGKDVYIPVCRYHLNN